jgi:hypothetical protein
MRRRTMHGAAWIAAFTAAAAAIPASLAHAQAGPAQPAPVPADSVRVVLPEASSALLSDGVRSGRMILFLVSLASDSAPPSRGAAPMDAPFFDRPQPMYSVAVESLSPGKAVAIDANAVSFPLPLDQLDGRYRVQAVFDRDRTGRGHASPGNLASAVSEVTLRRDAADAAELQLSWRIDEEPLPEAPNLRWFEMKSALLSRATGRDVMLRAGIALPAGWDDPNHRRRIFPAVYVVPGFGGRRDAAASMARLLADPSTRELVPQAAWVVLDPECPLGHHAFVDSAANGPWGTALVEELIPELERRFRLVRRPEGRIVTGHSSGGWSALWLQLEHPGTFGACFASSPDPVDFSRFQLSDLYSDASVFTDPEGKERPSYRVPLMKQFDKVCMTVREEASMERVLGPARDSGEQWDSWAATWSAVDPATKLPRPLFDSATGTIDRGVVRNEWSRYDIAARVRADPARLVPIFRERVRLLCGGRDGFYLERAVAGLQGALAAAADALMAKGQMLAEGPGYVTVVPEETHSTMAAAATVRWHREMRDWLRANGLD